MFKVTTVPNSPTRQTDLSDPPRPSATNVFDRYFGRYLIVGLSVLVLGPAIGCSGFGSGNGMGLGIKETVLVEYRDAIWARRAYNLRYGNCDRPFSRHYRDGFCEGYCNVCSGGDGYVPALPPNEYRGYEYQSSEGAQCVNTWFEGYPAGVAAAKKDRAGDFKEMFVSRMINSAVTQDNAKHTLPDDVPIIAPEKNTNDQGARTTTVAPPAPEMPAPPIVRGQKVTSSTEYQSGGYDASMVSQSGHMDPASIFEPYNNAGQVTGNTPLPMSINQPPVVRQANQTMPANGRNR